MHKRKFSVLLFAFLMLTVCSLSSAQKVSGDVGIGLQFGQPSGLSLNFYKSNGLSPDILLAWDLDDFIFINLHGILEKRIDDGGHFNFLVGPGLFVGIRDTGGARSSSNDFAAGISGTIGLGIVIDFFEIYARVTPRLELVEESSTDIGGGVGLRFYF